MSERATMIGALMHEAPMSGTATIRVSCARDVSEIDALREQWCALHDQDAQATVFTSWWWLRAWFEVSPYPWSVLVARDQRDQVVGLFPISVRGATSALRLDQVREIHTAGDPSADYRGFVLEASPEMQGAALDAFAAHLADDDRWDRLILKDVIDPRLPRFLDALRAREPALVIESHAGNVCPFLELPASWDAYLKHCLTPPSRKSLKKRLRIAEEHAVRLSTLREARSDHEREEQLRLLLHLAKARGKNTKEHLHNAERIFRSCLEGQCAEIAILHLDGEPAAAQGSFIDQHAQTVGHYLTGFDERFADLSPGRVLDALCIRDAIERGLRGVDFLRGDEPFKNQLGAVDRRTTHATITRPRLSSRVRGALSAARNRLGI